MGVDDIPEPISFDSLNPQPSEPGSFVKPNPGASTKPARERIFGRRESAPTATKTAKVPRHITEPASDPGEFVEPLEKLYGGVGMMTMPFHGALGASLMTSAHDCATAWDELAQKNPSVRHTLRLITQGGAWGAVMFAHLPILAAVLTMRGTDVGNMGKVFADQVEDFTRRAANDGDDADSE